MKNATACWQSVREDREWCEITVLSLQGDAKHDEIINDLEKNRDDPAGLSSFLQTLATRSMTDRSELTPEFAQALRQMPEVIKSFEKYTVECVDRFLEAANGAERFSDLQQESFACSIGKATGWLRMSYKVRDILFVLAVAPHV
ncbi:hypothetical protein [Mesorhizobium sp. M1406]|uniref:hypothetical protein n=1 Tax=Mesorhizobium sp. M1406 TaxID=2957099 RepID=UPI00333DE32D